MPTCLTIIPVAQKTNVDLHLYLAKCFERLAMQHIKECLSVTLIHYRSNRSTEDVISLMLHLALPHTEQRSTCVRRLFTDFSSAFNTIIPEQLLRKLQSMEVSNSICKWVFQLDTKPADSQSGKSHMKNHHDSSIC